MYQCFHWFELIPLECIKNVHSECTIYMFPRTKNSNWTRIEMVAISQTGNQDKNLRYLSKLLIHKAVCEAQWTIQPKIHTKIWTSHGSLRNRISIICDFFGKELAIPYNKFLYNIEAEKFQNLQSASWRLKRTNGMNSSPFYGLSPILTLPQDPWKSPPKLFLGVL